METETYLITSEDIEAMQGLSFQHFLNPNAVRSGRSLGDVTGLTGLGFHIVDVQPGRDSTEYHCHHDEDECVYVLSGRATATIGGDIHAVKAGDFIGYRKGGLAHVMTNTGGELLRCIVIGERRKHDVVDYINQRKRLYLHPCIKPGVVAHEHIKDEKASGDDELSTPEPAPGGGSSEGPGPATSEQARPMTNETYLVTKEDIEAMDGLKKAHFLNPNAVRINKSLGDLTGLTGLGFHIIDVEPGRETTEHHRHHHEDECVYILAGTAAATLGDETYPVKPGDFIGYRKGGLAHSIKNTGNETLRCIVAGERLVHDVGDYPRLNKRIFRHAGLKPNLVDLDHIEEPVVGAKR